MGLGLVLSIAVTRQSDTNHATQIFADASDTLVLHLRLPTHLLTCRYQPTYLLAKCRHDECPQNHPNCSRVWPILHSTPCSTFLKKNFFPFSLISSYDIHCTAHRSTYYDYVVAHTKLLLRT
jgi:hypothetical protein